MGDVYDKARELFEKELDRIVDKKDINATDLENSYKIVDILKDLEKICKLQNENGYSGRSRGSMGMRRSGRWPYYGDYGYSGTSQMTSKLHKMLSEASNDRERMMIQAWIDELGD